MTSPSSPTPPASCEKCGGQSPPIVEDHRTGQTVTCRSCGHSQDTDHNGHVVTPPEPTDFQPRSIDHQTNRYPLGLECTEIQLDRHRVAVRSVGTYFTPSSNELVTFYVYHQPYRSPNTSARRKASANRYVYAAEMLPYDDLIELNPKEYRDLRRLILEEASHSLGAPLKVSNRQWPICRPGTIARRPLAPAE